MGCRWWTDPFGRSVRASPARSTIGARYRPVMEEKDAEYFQSLPCRHQDQRSRRDYTEVLGLHKVARPDFGYPGAWLAAPGGAAIIHLYAGGPALGAEGRAPYGTAAIDHVSITATDFHGFIAKFKKHGLDWREFNVRDAKLWQLFVYDPNGVQLEITFEAAKESGPEPDMKNRGYGAGTSFFKVPEPA
jgi:catechol 2,3-dioxygenase-like lactoylglutathione lyase family enzyme